MTSLTGLSDLELALALADAADAMTMERFRAPDLVVRDKPDGSPVTDADVEVERELRERLREARPDHAVVGEEAGASGGSSWCWYLDPIDGTPKFAAGEPEWHTLIGLAHAGHVVLGVASAPALGRRWWAQRGMGAFCNGQPIHVSTTASLAEATISDDWRETLARGVSEHPLATLAGHCARRRRHQDLTALEVAAGHSDLALGIGGYPWDYAPIKIIVEEAGGRFTDLYGREAFDTGHALISNGLLHEEALRVLGDVARPTRSRGLDHVQVAAPAGCELEARRFYGSLLGLPELEKPPALRGRGGAWFACGRQQLHVGVEDEFTPARKAHPALGVHGEDLDGLAARLAGAGAPVQWDDALPGTRRFYTEDPWGNRIELVAVS